MANQITFRIVETALMLWLVSVVEGRDGNKVSGRQVKDTDDYFADNFGVYYTAQKGGIRGFALPKNAPNYDDAKAEFERWENAGIAWNHILVEAGLRKEAAAPAKKNPVEKLTTDLERSLRADLKDGKAPNLQRVKVVGGRIAAKYPGIDAGTRQDLFERLYRTPMVEAAKKALEIV